MKKVLYPFLASLESSLHEINKCVHHRLKKGVCRPKGAQIKSDPVFTSRCHDVTEGRMIANLSIL